MKDDKNTFFHGWTRDPHPHKLVASPAAFARSGVCDCGVAGLIKNIFLSSFAYLCINLFSFSICHANTILPQVCHLDSCVSVEVVSKQDDMERGLMYRKSLDENKGMLFAFSFDDKHQFWMKNMHFSLDMLWITADGHIVYAGRDIPACLADPCPVYGPDQNARYVLEINSGYSIAHHWNRGDQLVFKGIK